MYAKKTENNDRISLFFIWAQKNSYQRYRRHMMPFNTPIKIAHIK